MRRLLLALLLVGCSSTSDKKDVTEVDALARSGDLVADMVADSSGDVVPDLPAPQDIVETTDEVVPVADLAADLPPEVVPPPEGIPFDPGPYSLVPFETAGPFVLPTTKGDWDFEKEWSYGQDSYIFLSHAKGYDYVTQLWNSSIKDLIKYSPANVHYFFMSYDKDAATYVKEMETKVQAVLDEMEPWEKQVWEPRFHFVTEPAHLLDNWVGQIGKTYGYFAFAIDRFQKFRELGMLVNITVGDQASLRQVVYEVHYFNFEVQREKMLAEDEDEVTKVTLFELEQFGGSKKVEVDLPDGDTMAGFDTLVVDLTMHCKDHFDQNCGDWDYKSALYVCDVDDPETCDTEVARWITTYKRQGRWVTDISSMLALIAQGGTRTFRMDNSSQSYLTTLTFRLSNRGKGMRPVAYQKLWGGGGFNLNYNPGKEPIEFQVSAATKKVEVAAFITGHGFGSDVANCAEFCNHTHHFKVGNIEAVKDQPVAGSGLGCANQVKDGTVPNQYGTWPFGRGGWCPGLDVPPFVADFTDATQVGSNTVTYKALYQGKDYDPVPAPNPQGFGAQIWLTSYLIFWE
jgi:hypothetical protein